MNNELLSVIAITFGVQILLTTIAATLLLNQQWWDDDDQKERVYRPVAIPHQEEVPRINAWGYEFSREDTHCLALNVYFEARSESNRGQRAVAEVTLHRFRHASYPNTICEVVQDGYYYSWNPNLPVRHRCQFSWWCDGKSDNPVDGNAFEKALDVATEVLSDPEYELTMEYALFYHSLDADPFWVDSVNFVETIGRHSFYSATNRGHIVP